MRFLALLAPILALLGATACVGSTESPTGSGSSSGGGGGSEPTGPDEPEAKFLPAATGPCPEFVEGKQTFTPDGNARPVELWISDAAKDLDGPLVFFWHGAGGSPTEASYALGAAIKAITDMGGVVAAPYHDPSSSVLPWFLSLGGNNEGDLRVADEILACAIEKVGVDKRRIHSVGFSAGAMHTTQFAALRSGYLASVVVYSGARLGTPIEQNPSNKYPAMLFHGGPSDQVIVSFDDATKTYHEALTTDGHFSFICGHNKGHTVPSDARASSWQFLLDHPFGTTPDPYAIALPGGFPAYCAL